MKLHLDLDVKKLPWPINHKHKILLIGSCFTENIGAKLKKQKFNVLENPNGILFNPVSVAEAIIHYIDDRKFSGDDIFNYNEGWHSWKHHSRFSGLSADEALQKINGSTANAHEFLKQTDYIFITLGSAWTYTLTDKALNAKAGAVAANNHKAPSDWFFRRLMTTEEVLSVLDNMIHRLLHFKPGIRIIFTISPVRHIREGVIENNRSKAVLIQAVHHLVDKFEGLYYFPSYELVIDDLRDYRFYSEDMVHPNYFATEYVWDKFVSSAMDDTTKKIIEDLKMIHLAFQHKPFNPVSEQHKKFLAASLEKARNLYLLHPFLDLKKEIAYFQTGEKAEG
jgi:hypothetical protein